MATNEPNAEPTAQHLQALSESIQAHSQSTAQHLQAHSQSTAQHLQAHSQSTAQHLQALSQSIQAHSQSTAQHLQALSNTVTSKLKTVEEKIENISYKTAPMRTPYSAVPQEPNDKMKALRSAIRNLLKAGNHKYKTKVIIWLNTVNRSEVDSVDGIPNPIDLSTMTNLSAAAALKCCGFLDTEANEASAGMQSSENNPFAAFKDSRLSEDNIQSNLQIQWMTRDPCPLLAACDGRQPGKLPIFFPNGSFNSFDLSAKPDIVSVACPMVMEFKKFKADSELVDGLQQVLRRLHALSSVNCFIITRLFGFAVNGGASSFLVSIHRKLVLGQRHFYEDTIHILKIDTQHVAGIWNELTKKAQTDLCFVLHRDVFQLAATLKAMPPPIAQSTSVAPSPPPPPTSDWDLSKLMGYTKINLMGLSSSRVYGIYPIQEAKNKRKQKFLRSTSSEPMFLVKINSYPDRSCCEHLALKRLAESFASDSVPWAKLFYVHRSFMFDGWKVSDTATFSDVEVANRFPTWSSLQSLGVADVDLIASYCIDRQCIAPDQWWWNRLQTGPLPAGNFATVVMKQAHRFTTVSRLGCVLISRCGKLWLDRIHNAGVLHTDIRPSNIMWLSVKRGTDIEKYGGELCLIASAEDVVVKDTASRTDRPTDVVQNLESRFETMYFEDQSAELRSQDDVVIEGSEASDGPDAEQTTETAMGGVTAAPAIDDAVDREVLMLPIVVDYDCAAMAIDGKATLDISIDGARPKMIKKVLKVASGETSVQWARRNDAVMLETSAGDL